MGWDAFTDLVKDLEEAGKLRSAGKMAELQPHILSFDDVNAEPMNEYVLGLIQEFRGEFDDAYEHHRRALEGFKRVGNTDFAARVTNSIGSIHYFKGEYPEAMEHYNRAIDMQSRIGKPIVNPLNNIGAIYFNVGDYAKALEYFQRVVHEFEEQGDLQSVADILVNVGNVYGRVRNYDLAMTTYLRVLEIREQINSDKSSSLVYANLANSCGDAGREDEAINYATKALESAIADGDDSNVRRAQMILANVLARQEKFDDAEIMILENDLLNAAEAQFRINNHRELGYIRFKKGAQQEGIKLLKEALSIAEDLGMRSSQAATHQVIRELAREMKDAELFLQHHDAMMELDETLRNREVSVQVAMHAKEREFDEERAEYDKQRSLLFSALPRKVAERILNGENVNGDVHQDAAVVFIDIASFTQHSRDLPPEKLIDFLAEIFEEFDTVCATHDVTKIKTIGDAYLAVAFGEKNQTAHRATNVALEIMDSVFLWPDGSRVDFRIGMHNGSVVAGVIGTERLQYDVWGDTVNVASRMESTGEPGRIHVSEAFADVIARSPSLDPRHSVPGTSSGDDRHFVVTMRGDVDVKGRGTMTTFWLEGA